MKEKLLRHQQEIFYCSFLGGYLLAGVLALLNARKGKRHA